MVVQYEAIAEGILLLLVVIVIVLDLMVITALITTSTIACSIRWILANLLLAGVVGALASVLRHTIAVVQTVYATAIYAIDGFTYCRTFTDLATIGNTGRVLMAAFYAVTVFIVVRCWNKPVLAAKNTKYFIIAALLVWLLMILLVMPFLLDEAIAALFCSRVSREREIENGTIGIVVFIIISTFPILVTIIFLVLTICYIKRHTIRAHSASDKALLKFGFFITIGQAINAAAQIMCPAVLLVLSSHRDRSAVVTVLSAIFDLSLMTTPILTVIFFKPVWHKLRKWLCNCCRNCSIRFTAASPVNTQPHITKS